MKRFFRWIRKKKAPKSNNKDTLIMLLEKLTHTEPHEISCDDVHAVLAEFTERRRQGEDVSHLMPKVQHHLVFCPECREEYEALLLAIEAENNLE